MHCQITGRKERGREEDGGWPDCDIGRRIVEFHRGRIPSARYGVSGVPRRSVFRLCVYSTLNAPRSILLFVQTNDSLNGKSINLDGGSIAIPSANEKFRSFSFSSEPALRERRGGGADRSVSDRKIAIRVVSSRFLFGSTRGSLERLGRLYRGGKRY